jgi:hypothetical protein
MNLSLFLLAFKQVDKLKFKTRISGFGETDFFLEYYKSVYSELVGSASERTMKPAIMPPKVSFVHSVNAIIFKNMNNLLVFQAVCSSIIIDFFIKTKGASHLNPHTINGIPINIPKKIHQPVFCRTLLLNCLTKYYSYLWENFYNEIWCNEKWTKNDSRLKSFNNLKKKWSWNIPLRNSFERRHALVEIDVLVAIAFNLTLEELISIYIIQFPVLQQNEEETFYDRNGRIVYSVNKGINDVGVDRHTWNEIKDLKSGEYVWRIHTELYPNKKITYMAPFDKCDRVEDYKQAWTHFKKVFPEE